MATFFQILLLGPWIRITTGKKIRILAVQPNLSDLVDITELCEAFLAVWLLAQTRIISFGGRIGFVAAVGIVAAIATNVSYWNWWGFPTVYTVSYMFIQLVGFFLVGVVAAIMFRRITA